MFMFDDDSSMGNSTEAAPYYFPDENDCRTCNICASSCPTFSINRDSLESPRGRLKLMKKVLLNGESLSAEEQQHLESCLQCRACESVCPSKMQYAELLSTTNDKLEQQSGSPLVRAMLYATSDKRRLQQLFNSLRLSQQWGLQTLARRLGLFKIAIPEYLDDLLPKIPKPQRLQSHYPAIGTRRGAVGLFTGCLTSVLDSPTIKASIDVLTRLGYEVHIPENQQCCGGLHRHNGDPATAEQLAATNLEAFAIDTELDAILVTATGCAEPLLAYENQQFASKVQEINQFVAQQSWPDDLQLQPLNQKVMVHEPCSQRFPLGTQQSVYQLLEHIPGIELQAMPDNQICCGAGGTYMLTHPENSDAIRAQKLQHLQESQARLLVSANIGCALHLAAGINKEKMDVVVAHPVELLAQQL